jgi:hypothetical protein
MSSKFKVQSSKSQFFKAGSLLNSARRIFFSRLNHRALLITFSVLLTICGSFLTTNAQKRDNLTNEEDLQIRETQELDARMKALMHVVNRRLLALSTPNAAESKQIQKETSTWGALRTGTTMELFSDIQRTLDEAIAKIDDVAAREQKNPLFAKAVNILSESCQKFTPQFRSFIDRVSDPKERALISNSIENCTLIIEASARVPKEEKKEEKKKKN